MRISILEILAMDGGRILSPSDLSHELQMPLSNVNYHVTELAKTDLLQLAFKRQVRGATEHFYRMAGVSSPAAHENGNGVRTNDGRPREHSKVA